jgi:hypothetical protein
VFATSNAWHEQRAGSFTPKRRRDAFAGDHADIGTHIITPSPASGRQERGKAWTLPSFVHLLDVSGLLLRWAAGECG